MAFVIVVVCLLAKAICSKRFCNLSIFLSFVTINIILLELVAKCHVLLLGHMSKIIMDSFSHVCACVLNQFNSY